MSANCLIIAGEKSGEEHALSFLPELQEKVPGVHYWGVGGDELKQRGMELLYHLKDFSSWGFSEVIGKIPFYFNALKRIEQEVERRGTKVAILVDFQDFNLRLAKRLSKKGVRVLYYVAPQAWAWKSWRAKVLEETVDTLFTIIPFEKKWFMDRGVKKVVGVDHPLWMTYGDRLDSSKLGLESKPYQDVTKKLKLLLLPGSRNSEVKHFIEPFFKTAQQIKKERNVEIWLVRSSNVNPHYYEPYLDNIDKILPNEELETALTECHLALACSGTVTLACALFEVPTVVCYGGSLFNEWIFYSFINYQGLISLGNIVHQEEIFPELVQEQVSPYNIQRSLNRWLLNETAYNQVKNKLAQTRTLVQGDGNAAMRMAEVIKQEYGSNS